MADEVPDLPISKLVSECTEAERLLLNLFVAIGPWVMDSELATHTCNTQEAFVDKTIQAGSSGSIYSAMGARVQRPDGASEDVGVMVLLENVQYTPMEKFNWISVWQLRKQLGAGTLIKRSDGNAGFSFLRGTLLSPVRRVEPGCDYLKNNVQMQPVLPLSPSEYDTTASVTTPDLDEGEKRTLDWLCCLPDSRAVSRKLSGDAAS